MVLVDELVAWKCERELKTCRCNSYLIVESVDTEITDVYFENYVRETKKFVYFQSSRVQYF